MTLGPVLPVQRTLAIASAWLLLLGLLTGFYASAAMTGQIPVDGHAALAAHLNALLGAFFIHAVAWSMPLLRYGPVGQRRLGWLVIGANYANWFITTVKASLKVAGLAKTGEPKNDAVLGLLALFVVIPSVIAAIAWVAGFRKASASAESSVDLAA